MCGHVQLETCLQKLLGANRALDHFSAASWNKVVCVRNADMPRQAVAMDKSLTAMWTALGRFIMSFPMPGYLGFCVKHLAAPADEILLAWTNIKMFALAMQNEIRLTAKTSQADFALKTSLGTVHIHVFNQVVSADKAFGTILALVIFDVKMALEVYAEVVPVAKFTAACIAFRWMDRHVFVEAPNTFECGVANHAHVRIRLGRQNR